MKSMGTPPPRNKETDAVLKAIWSEQCDQRNKPPISQAALNDQIGAAAYVSDNAPSLFDCCECGESYQLGRNVIHDGHWDKFWCESCFRKMALREYGII